MVDNSKGGSGIRKGRRGGKKRSGGNEGRVEDTGGSNDGPQQQTKQLKQQQSFPVVADPRFASMHSAPNFRRSKPDERKVQLDDRFKAVLTDPRFRVSDAKVDKYGRKVKKASRAAEDQLRAFYKVDEEENDGEENNDGEEESAEEEERKHVVGREEEREGAGGLDDEGSDDEEANDDEEESGLGVVGGGGGEGLEKGASSRSPAEAESRQAYLTKLSRGEISVSDSSDSSSEDDDGHGGAHSDSEDSEAESSADDGLSLGRGRGTQSAEGVQAPMSEETSRRLAVTNCDWDHMRARDLMVLCGSFCPGNARLSSVTVYPSDFGLEMMKLETAAGPHAVLAEGKLLAHEDVADSAHSSTDEDEDDQHMEDDEQGQEDQADAELGGVSTAAGVAVDGKVVRRRRPGVIIEEYRANSSSGEEEEESGNEGTGRRSRELQSLEGGRRGGGDSFDPEKLRAYELRKLKYYFAVLEFSSAAAAETVYREVDGMEFERSAVALDLRFVPDGVSFDGREARDSCTSIPSSYQPPSFICKALQQTKVECTWDEVPTERQVLLGRMSQWRDAAEGDFEAYLATSSEESDDDESTEEDDKAGDGDDGSRIEDDGSRIKDDGNKSKSTNSKRQGNDAKEKKKKLSAAAARRARRLLLQDVLESDEGSGEEDDEDGNKEGEENEAFSSTGGDYDDREREEEEDGNAEFTFVSRGTTGAGDDQDGREGGVEALLERKKQRDALAKETPWEASLRKERERKRARKKAFKERLQEQGGEGVGAVSADDDDFFLEEASSGRAGEVSKELEGTKGRNLDDDNAIWNSSASARGAAKEDEDEEERRDYDMHGLVREEKMRGKKLKGNRKRKEMAREKVPGQDFTVDVKDERFAAVLEGDTRFGIDRTDSSFKDTEGMRQILEERARRRDRRHGNPTKASSVLRGEAAPANGLGGIAGEGSKDRSDLSSLVSKLKTRGIGSGDHGQRVAAKADKVSSRVDGGDSSAVRADLDDVSVGGAGKGRRGKKKRRRG